MAKRNYTSRIEQSVMQFGNEDRKEETKKIPAQNTKQNENITEMQENDNKTNQNENKTDNHNVNNTVTETAPQGKSDEIPKDFLKRGTYFLTYAETEAINTIAYRRMAGKSMVLREALEKGLEEMCPGILAEVSERAEKRKERDFGSLTEEERKKIIKKAEKD